MLNKKDLFILPVMIGGIFYSVTANALSLEKAVLKSLKDNPEFVTQTHQQKISEDTVSKSNSGYMPRLDFNAAAGYQYSPHAINKKSTPLNGALVLTQPIFSGLSTVYSVEESEEESKQEFLKTFSTAEQISLAITQAYLEVLRTQETLKLSEENLNAHERLEVDIKDRYTNGVSNRSDLTQMEGRTSLAKSNVMIAVNDLEDAKANYEALTGFEIDSFEKPEPDMGLVPIKRKQALEMAAIEHPLLKAAKRTISASLAQYEGTKSPYMPNVDVVLKAAWDDEDVTAGIGRDDGYSAKVVMNWNLFRGGEDKVNRQIASSQVNVAKSTRDNTYRQVMQEVRLAWAAYTSASRQKTFNDEHAGYSKETKALYEQQYKVNKRTLLDVLDIKNELFRAKTAYISSDYAELAAKYRLLRSTGQMLKSINLEGFVSSVDE